MRARVIIAVVVALIGAGVVGLAPSAAAADIAVTTTDDVVNGADGFTSLREAFATANASGGPDTIILGSAQSYDLDDCGAGALTATADDDLTIDGNGSTITQTCDNTGILQSDDPDSLFTVDDVDLVGGPNTNVSVDGAGVLSQSQLVLSNSTVTGVDGGPGGNVIDGGMGGAAYPEILLTNTEVTGNDNTAVNIDFGGVNVVAGSVISDNNGDGIGLIDGSPVVVTDSTISNNARRGVSTTGQGSTNLTITDSTVSLNGDTGVSCSACGTTSISGSTITGNGDSTPVSGGGVSMTVDQDAPTDAPTMTITDSAVTDNVAVRRGGGVFVGIIESSEPTAPPTEVAISGSQITGNETHGNDVDGGGIALITGDLSVTGSTIADNSTGIGGNPIGSDGGGIYARESDTDGIDVPYNVDVEDTSVTNNSARGAGGGMAVGSDGTVTVTTSSFDLNDALGASGGIDLRALSASITDSVLSQNTGVSGGGLTFSGNNIDGFLTIDRTTINGNQADTTPITGGTGGGIDMSLPSGADMLIRNSTISGNAAWRGGGFHAGVDQLITAEHTTFYGNSANFASNIRAPFSPFTLSRSIVANPLGGGQNCGPSGPGSFATLGYNFTSDNTCVPGPNDTVSAADPQLGGLDDNGGLTATHLPADTSPVVGLVPIAQCTQTVDQRNAPRPAGTGCEAGSVEIVGAAGPTPITGTNGFDLLHGTPGPDLITALGGTDIVKALASDDTVDGGDGNDLIFGGPGNDTLNGGNGNDLLSGEDGNDTLNGGPGLDILIGGSGTNTFNGGPGPDICFIPGRFLPSDC
ncbi:MAG: beta strand repeat-containing protein [Acidimicrobiales bacterium]